MYTLQPQIHMQCQPMAAGSLVLPHVQGYTSQMMTWQPVFVAVPAPSQIWETTETDAVNEAAVIDIEDYDGPDAQRVGDHPA